MKFNCKWCKKEFEDWKCRKDWRKTCSRSCQIKLANTGRKNSKLWGDFDLYKKHYLDGKTFKEIGEEFKIDKTTLQRIFQKAGIQVRRVGMRGGEKHYYWLGGKSFEPYSTDWTETLRRSIRERDKYTCQLCGKENSIHCHHIDYDKKNCNPNNLIILCRKCHSITNFNRNYWIKYFPKL